MLKLSLFNNAIHSLYHALEMIDHAESADDSDREFDAEDHLISWRNERVHLSFYLEGYSRPPRVYGYKFVILSLIQTIELLLKAHLHDNMGLDIFLADGQRTITLGAALRRILDADPILLNQKQRALIKKAATVRNEIQHYEFDYDLESARDLSRQLFTVISHFLNSIFDINVDRYFEFDQWCDDEDPIAVVIRNLRLGVY